MRLFLRLNIVMVLLVAAALVGCKQEKDSSGGGVPGAAPIGGDSGGSDNFNGIVDSTPSNPDTSNAASGPNGPVRIIEETADGSVVMVGDFTEYDSQPSPGIVIVGSDGQVDQDFMESIGNGFNGRISGVKATEDGSVVIAGEFTDLNGSAQPNVVVVDSDGEIDTELSEALQNSVRGPVTSVDLHDGDQIVLAGSGETPLVAVDSESMEEVEATEEDEGHDLVDEAKESGDTHKKKKKKRKKRKRMTKLRPSRLPRWSR